MPPITAVLALVIFAAGAIAGGLGIVLGLGGGIFLVPFLTLALGFPLKSAAAARSGIPHHAFSTGTLMIPPPMPSSDDRFPATNDASSASGTFRIWYVTMPPLSAS